MTAMLSPQAVAERTGLHYRTVLREIERGHLHAYEVAGGQFRVDPEDFDAWRHAHPVAPRRKSHAAASPSRRRRAGSTERGSSEALRAIEGGRA